MKLTDEQWKYLFDLRNELEDDEDRRALRRLIRRTEQVERRIKAIKSLVERWCADDGDDEDVED